MGDPRKPKNKFERPRKPWDKQEIELRNALCEKYGLKNKRELWVVEAFLRKKRAVARKLLALPLEERLAKQRELVDSLEKINVLKKDATLDDVLNIKIEDLLERRLQTIVWRKGLARTVRQARQLITHGHIAIGDRVVNVPGYLVLKSEESKIRFANPEIEEKIKAMAIASKPRGEANE